MSQLLKEEQNVPIAHEQEPLEHEEEALISMGKLESNLVHSPLAYQIQYGEETLDYFDKEGKDPSMTTLDYNKGFKADDNPSSSNESSESDSSPPTSELDSTESDPHEVPVFNPPIEHKSEVLSANNEIVSGHEHNRCQGARPYEDNLPVTQTYPQQQTNPSYFTEAAENLVTKNDLWPPMQCPSFKNHEVIPMDTCALLSQDQHRVIHVENRNQPQELDSSETISNIEALTLEDNAQQVVGRGDRSAMVIGGLSETTTQRHNHVDTTLLTPDVIKKERQYMEEFIDAFGKALHPLVSEAHNDPNSGVRFVPQRGTRRQSSSSNGNICRMEDVMQTSEASDGRKLLQHIKTNFSHYDSILNNRNSTLMKWLVKSIRGRIPKRLPNLTWKYILDTVKYMRMLIESIVECLESADRLDLAETVRVGIDELNDITESASRARRLSQQFNT